MLSQQQQVMTRAHQVQRSKVKGQIILCHDHITIYLLHIKNTAKGANLLHPLDVQRAKKTSASGGRSPPEPSPGGSAPCTPAGAPPQTSVIGSRCRARHGPHTFWHLSAPMVSDELHEDKRQDVKTITWALLRPFCWWYVILLLELI